MTDQSRKKKQISLTLSILRKLNTVQTKIVYLIHIKKLKKHSLRNTRLKIMTNICITGRVCTFLEGHHLKLSSKWYKLLFSNCLCQDVSYWSEAGTKFTKSCPFWNFSRRKHKSISTCFIFEGWIGLSVKATTPMLWLRTIGT